MGAHLHPFPVELAVHDKGLAPHLLEGILGTSGDSGQLRHGGAAQLNTLQRERGGRGKPAVRAGGEEGGRQLIQLCPAAHPEERRGRGGEGRGSMQAAKGEADVGWGWGEGLPRCSTHD